MRKRWQFWVGLVISIFFVYLALRNLHLADVWQAMKTAKYWWLVPGVAVYFLGVWVRTWRWHYLLRPLKKIPTRTMFPIVCIGYMGNNIYPARAGEVLRAVILKQREGVSVSASLATIIVERIFDGVVMLGFVFFSLPQLTGLDSASGFIGSIRELSIIGAIVFAVALAGFLLAAMFPQTAEKIASWFIDRLVPRRFREPVRSFTLRFIGDVDNHVAHAVSYELDRLSMRESFRIPLSHLGAFGGDKPRWSKTDYYVESFQPLVLCRNRPPSTRPTEPTTPRLNLSCSCKTSSTP